MNSVSTTLSQLNSHNSLISPPSWPPKLSPLALHGPLGDFVKTIEPRTESDSVAVLAQGLAAFGNIIGKKPHWTVEGKEHALKIYPVLVGNTGKGRKGTAWSCVKRLFSEVEQIYVKHAIKSGLASGEGLIKTLSDRKDESGAVITTVTDKRLLVVEEEFASILKIISREGSILSGIIRQAWDGSDFGNLTKHDPLEAFDTHVTIIGHVTVTELRKYLNDNEKANGFGNRFLWLCVKRSKLLPEGGDIHKLDLSPFSTKIKEAVEFSKTVGELVRDEEANQVWHTKYPILTADRLGMIGFLTGRAESYVMRLAALYALLDSSNKIRIPHLEAALALWEYSEASINYIFSDSSGIPLANEIFNFLYANYPCGCSRTEISSYFNGHQSSEQISAALISLRESGKVFQRFENTEGRNKEMWFAAKKED